MTDLEKLLLATTLAQEEEDLPDFLAERIFLIAENLTGRNIFKEEIAALTEQIRQYDTFGQTGYIGMGVDNLILEKSIQRLEKQLMNVS